MPVSSAGCALPAKTICTGRRAAFRIALQPLGVVEDQLGALVAGEAPREADRERIRIEQRAGGDDARGADLLVAPALASALADEGEQVLAQRLRAAQSASSGMSKTRVQNVGSS